MFYSTSITVWLGVLLSAVYLSQKWKAYRAFHAAVIQHGCQRPRKYAHRDPFFGTDLVKERQAAIQARRVHRFAMDCFERYGKTYEEKFFDKKVINTMEGVNIQQVVAHSFHDYVKTFVVDLTPLFGPGIFLQDGAIWKHSRDLIKPIFARSELSDVDSFAFHFDRFLKKIPRDGSTIDLQTPLRQLTLDASTDFLFGQSLDSQLSGDPNDSAGFLDAMALARVHLAKHRRYGNFAPILFAFDRKGKAAYGKVHSYIDAHVKRALKETEENSTNEKQQKRYVLLHEMAKHVRDPINLRFQILNVFEPARSTISILIGNALFYLARNPELWAKLREQSLAIRDKPLTFELLISLQLFRDVINETLRLAGPTGRAQRAAIRNTILPSGGGPDGKSPIFVEKGTVITLNMYGQNHDKDIWGDDVYEFKPERWVDRRPMWDFIPFLGGPRICPAVQQVRTQAVYLLVRLTMEFTRMENRDSVMEWVEDFKMTVTESANGVKVAFFP